MSLLSVRFDKRFRVVSLDLPYEVSHGFVLFASNQSLNPGCEARKLRTICGLCPLSVVIAVCISPLNTLFPLFPPISAMIGFCIYFSLQILKPRSHALHAFRDLLQLLL